VNRHSSVGSNILLCFVAIILPLLIALLTYDEAEADFGDDGWTEMWRGFPLHFVVPKGFGDQFWVGSVSYLTDCVFWLVMLFLLRRWIIRRRWTLRS
jgi:hypothetical protein